MQPRERAISTARNNNALPTSALRASAITTVPPNTATGTPDAVDIVYMMLIMPTTVVDSASRNRTTSALCATRISPATDMPNSDLRLRNARS
jgi:hypothetical protein